jgi:hypothetical protein
MMQTFNLFSWLCVSLFVVTLCNVNSLATEKDKEPKPDKPTLTSQLTQPEEKPQGDKVEPMGKESGKVVDVPANLADKIGKKINKALGNKDDQ